MNIQGIEFKESKYMYMKGNRNEGRKTIQFNIFQKGTDYSLGIIKWFPNWRSYCYFPTGNTVFDSGCLEMILSWVNTANEFYKESRKNNE